MGISTSVPILDGMKPSAPIYESALVDVRFQLENLAVRWLLVALYAFFVWSGMLSIDRAWFAASEGFLVVFHLYYSVHTWYELTREPLPRQLSYAIPFLDTVAVSLALVAVGDALHPIWGVYFFIIVAISFFYHAIARFFAVWLVACYACAGLALYWRGLEPPLVEMLIGSILLVVGMYNLDVYSSTERRLRSRIADVARHDPLTNLLNRRGLEDELEGCLRLAEDSQAGLAVFVIDIDRFKRFNDRFGHLAADRVLEQLGQTLSSAVRRPDLVARFGGDEFVLIVPDVTERDALALAERLRYQVERLGLCTISIGVSVSGAGETSKELLDHADSALLSAKAAGRNSVQSYASAGRRAA
jgi:diguanylate cyclase (GGDEF)-like protein